MQTIRLKKSSQGIPGLHGCGSPVDTEEHGMVEIRYSLWILSRCRWCSFLRGSGAIFIVRDTPERVAANQNQPTFQPWSVSRTESQLHITAWSRAPARFRPTPENRRSDSTSPGQARAHTHHRAPPRSLGRTNARNEAAARARARLPTPRRKHSPRARPHHPLTALGYRAPRS